MEREIIFRAKAVNTEMWAYGDLVHNQKVTKEGLEPRTMVGGYEVYKDTIGQFIGRTDKNGTKIYDGDIFKLAPSENGTVVNKYIVRVSDHLTVEIRNIELEERFFPFSPMRDDWWEDFKDEIEVIGNIYDNPELIK